MPSALNLPALGPSGKSATERTLSYLRRQGYFCWIVERRLRAQISQDMFHIIDIIALTDEGVMGVQSTGSDFAGHRRNLLVTRKTWTERWLACPNRTLMLIGWRRVKQGPGGRDVWKERVEMITPETLRGA